jgi:two-component system, NarL family, nitrate/nitrite response regulator NarL
LEDRRLIRVLVADDHPVYRAGIIRALEEHDELELIAEAHDGRTALAKIRALRPDVALLDARMPQLGALEVL